MADEYGLGWTVWALPFFIATMLLEVAVLARTSSREMRDLMGYEPKDTAASLTMGIGNVIIGLGTKAAAFGLFAWVHSFSPWSWSASSPWTWVALIVLTDLCFYWFHRLHHEIRFLWAAHVNHHSSRHYNLSTALRQSWGEPFTGIPFYLPLALIGFDPLLILTGVAINTLAQYWVHTEKIGRLGPIEWIFNTPSHHRVHHGSNVRYLDRNYAGMFIVWDRLFGTFEPEGEKVDFGITKNIDTFNPLRIASHEWIAMFRDAFHADSLSDAFGYLFQPPGWSTDGSTLTAPQMQARVARGLPAMPVADPSAGELTAASEQAA